MSAVAVSWLALRLASPADQPFTVGASVAAYTLPGAAGAVLLAPLLRHRDGVRLVAADATVRAVMLGMIPVLYWAGALSVPVYVALLAASSVLHSWGIAGQYTTIAEHLPPEARLSGNALLSTCDMAALIIGPVLAGLLVAVNPAAAIAANAASFVVLAAAGFSARVPPRVPEDDPERDRKPERTSAFRLLVRNRTLVGLLSLTCLFFLLYGPVEVALPLYVIHGLHGNAVLLATFWVVFGIGALIGSITTGLLRRLPLWPTILASVIGWGAALSPIGLLSLSAPALACFAIGGLLYSPYTALSAALFQREAPPASLAQVLAARGSLVVLAAPVGTALGGPLVAALGAPRTLLASGLATVALGVAAALVSSAARVRAKVAADKPV
jgi:Na+/melibiose symporter-like transporter